MDEVGFIEKIGVNGLVVRRTGIRSFLKKTSGFKVWTSFIEYISAIEIVLPSFVFFKGKSI